jgi:hypothetical protein
VGSAVPQPTAAARVQGLAAQCRARLLHNHSMVSLMAKDHSTTPKVPRRSNQQGAGGGAGCCCKCGAAAPELLQPGAARCVLCP